MNKLLLPCLLLAVLPQLRGDARRVGEAWVLEDPQLKVTITDESAHVTVLDKASGAVWAQQDPAKQSGNQDQVRAYRAAKPVTVDGNPQEWASVPAKDYVWLPWKGDNGEANCSGGAKVMWDDQMLYLYVRVRDDHLAFGGEATTEWWEADSVEFWVDSVQVGLHLAPDGKEVAVNPRGEVFADARVAKRLVHDKRLPGYELEVAMPLRYFPVLKNPAAGVRFSFAIGLNDADPKPGEPVKRDRQSYSPRSWTHSAPTTFAVAVLTDPKGEAPARTRENDRSATATGGRISGMKLGKAPNSLTYTYSLTRGQTTEVPLQVTWQLVPGQAAVDVELVCAAGGDTPLKPFSYPFALYPEKPETYFMGVANYTDGRYLPVGDSFCRNREFCRWGGDLPFLLVTDGTKGLDAILLTPWDGGIQMQTRSDDAEKLGFPGFRWHPSKGIWGETRRGRLVFFDKGGHVTACKIYRELAKEQGLVRTFTEKAKVKPNVRKLFGAVNWWGGHGLTFVREAKAAGMTHGLLNGRPNPKDMAEIVKLGWLAGEYDNYEDINDSPTIARAKAPVKDHAVVKADGEFMTAWITRDKDMNPIHTYMKQCTAMMTKSARVVIPKVLATYPFNTRFLDVTTATSLKECYSPVHGVTRKQDQACREQLCAYVGDELGLVAGGEHGKYYDVRFLDYHEGMMGGASYSWPAGYLRDVKSRDELSDRYLKYSIDPTFRVPMFELVFHDCVVDYWYWGATNDYLHKVAPEITDRKTAMNVLYGTPPMMWVNNHGLRWGVPEERELMIDIYRQTCKLHEVVADQEMVSHEFVSPDRKVQRSTFADGTVCTVNFGDEPYAVSADGRTFKLGTNDFYVKGPKIEQWRVRTGGANDEREVYIRTDSVLVAEQPHGQLRQSGIAASGKIWLERNDTGARLSLKPGSSMDLDVGAWYPAWRGQPVAVLVLDATGKAVGRGAPVQAGKVHFAAKDKDAQFALLVGRAAAKSDVVVTELSLTAAGQPVGPGQAVPGGARLAATATVKNLGLAAAANVVVKIQLDGVDGPVLFEKRLDQLKAGGQMTLQTELPVSRADGNRRIVASIGGNELTQTGPAEQAQAFEAPVDPAAFPIHGKLQVVVPPGDAKGFAVEQPFTLPAKADPAYLRVLFPSGASTAAQFEPETAGARDGALVFVLPGGLTAGPTQATLLAAPTGDTRVYPPASPFTVAKDGSRLVFGTYSAKLFHGTLTDIAVRQPDGRDFLIVSSIIESSKETGWSSEEGELTDFALEHSGPVRTVFRMAKTLKGGFKLTRRFFFYADRCEIVSSCTPHRGLLTRTMYTADGTATHELGGEVAMDGVGNNEDFGFKGNPQWFAAYSPKFRSACFALTPAAGFTYWDSGSRRGQIGLGAPAETERRVYVWGQGAANADFAKQLWQAYATAQKPGKK
jgi:hypothetical protein